MSYIGSLALNPMPLLEHPDLRHGLARLTSGMLGFMDGGTASYSEDDIDRCRAILVSHAEALEHAKDRTAALELVKSTVTQLNTLNRDAGQDLIETDQREEICGFIIRAGAIMGFNSEAEDVTEEWREWQGLTNKDSIDRSARVPGVAIP